MTPNHQNIRIEIVEWGMAESAIKAVRATVFILEQGVPVELEWDGLDPLCAHVLAWTDRDRAIGTARLLPQGTIGRMAVLKDWRRQGVGAALLRKLLELATSRGLPRVTLSAQTHAIGFYEQAGFHAASEPFLDAGIPHRKMVRDLLLPLVDP